MLELSQQDLVGRKLDNPQTMTEPKPLLGQSLERILGLVAATR